MIITPNHVYNYTTKNKNDITKSHRDLLIKEIKTAIEYYNYYEGSIPKVMTKEQEERVLERE